MIKEILKTATFRQSSITFSATVLNGALGALFYMVVARILGPVEFGLFTVSIVILTLISDISDIGTSTGLVRFVSQNLAINKEKAFKFLKLSLEIKFIAWVISATLIFLFSQTVAVNIFHNTALIFPLKLVAIGAGGALLFSFATSSLQAFQKYFFWSGINIFTNLLRLMLVIIISFVFVLNVNNVLFIYILFPFSGFLITLLFLPFKRIIQSKDEFSLSKELFKYNIPVAVFSVIAAFSARLDTFLTASLLSPKDVGIYGAATQLTQVVPQLVAALGLVAAPKFSSFQNTDQMLAYLKKFQLLVSALFILGMFSIPLLTFAISIIYGGAYNDAVVPFIFLFIAMLVFLFSVPVHNSVIYYFGRPDVFIWVSAGHLFLIGGMGYFMIKNFGVVGASITVLAGTIFNFLYPFIWMLVKLRKVKA